MPTLDNRHSRRVALLKVVLPLIALGILSTLFLVADRRGTGDRIPYSQVELDRIIREQRITNPNYSGVTADGAAITLASESVRPDPGAPGTLDAARLLGTIETEEGTRVDLSSRSASFEGGETVDLSGDVRIRSSAGYRVESEAMQVDLERGTVISDRPVTATGPPGRLEAGGMALTRQDDRYVLTFTDGVKLLYRPEGEQEE